MPTIFETKPKKSAEKPAPTLKQRPTHMGPLTAFAVNPDGVRFETQEEEEVVILFLRQHVIVNLPWVVVASLLILAPTVLIPLFARILSITVNIPVGYLIIGTLFWYLATVGFILANFISWFFNIYIVTNERVVDIDFFYLLYKHFSQAELGKIQDISYSAGGVFAAVCNFGNVIIETAGEAPNLEFHNVPFPEKVVETIRSLTEKRGGGI